MHQVLHRSNFIPGEEEEKEDRVIVFSNILEKADQLLY